MALYLGGDSIDLKLGTKTLLLSAIYLHDLTAYYQKPETYTKDEIIGCLDGLLSSIQQTFYSKSEISSIIYGMESPYIIDVKQEKSGDIQIKNSITTSISPSADVNVIFPRTIVNANQIGRDFFLQIYQPSSVVDVTFSGYEGEQISFKTKKDGELPEMEANSLYLFWFFELSCGQFMANCLKLEDVSLSSESVEETDISTYYLINDQINYIELTENCRMVFPSRPDDLSGNMVPRNFGLYIRQSDLSAFDFEFVGREGETLLFKGNEDSYSGADISGEYFYAFTELGRSETSSWFIPSAIKLEDVDL